MKKVIFSTMGLYQKRNVAAAFLMFFAGEIFLFLFCSPTSILFRLLTPVTLLPLWKAYFMKKSYVVLYEDYVTGLAIPQHYLSMPRKFRLTYDEISFVEIHHNTVKLFYDGGSYTVQACNAASWVAQVIKDKQVRL